MPIPTQEVHAGCSLSHFVRRKRHVRQACTARFRGYAALARGRLRDGGEGASPSTLRGETGWSAMARSRDSSELDSRTLRAEMRGSSSFKYPAESRVKHRLVMEQGRMGKSWRSSAPTETWGGGGDKFPARNNTRLLE